LWTEWCRYTSVSQRLEMSIETVGLVGLFREIGIDLGSASFGAEGRHALANVSRRAFRATVSSLLLLEALDLAEQGVAVKSIVLLWDWSKFYDASFRWHTENVCHERLDQRSVALIRSSLHLRRKRRKRQDIAGLESARKSKARAVIDIDHHGRVWP
jgi:hypothetical protein